MPLPCRAGYLVAERPRNHSSAREPNISNTNPVPSSHSNDSLHVPYNPNISPVIGANPSIESPFPYSDLLHMADNQSIGLGFGAEQNIPTMPIIAQPDPLINSGTFNARFTDIFRSSVNDTLSAEELLERRNYVRNHRLLQPLNDLLTTCKKENILPEPHMQPEAPSDDFGLEDFLDSQGIDTQPLNSEEGRNAQREEFLMKLGQLQYKYKEEIEKLNKVCSECCQQLIFLLRDQSNIRPVGEQEATAKMLKIKHKFDYVKNQLRVCVCSAISALQKQYNQTRKKHKSLPKKATGSLTQWFFEHIQNPYPSEQEKALLAATGGLTLTQVNNWFGNKRIRYKRKCLENENKPGPITENDMSDSGEDMLSEPQGETDSPPPHQSQGSLVIDLPTHTTNHNLMSLGLSGVTSHIQVEPSEYHLSTPPLRKSTRIRNSKKSVLDDDLEDDE